MEVVNRGFMPGDKIEFGPKSRSDHYVSWYNLNRYMIGKYIPGAWIYQINV